MPEARDSIPVPQQVLVTEGTSADANIGYTAATYFLDRANHTGAQAISTVTGLQTALDGKQETLVSGGNIRTINGESLLGSTNLVISDGGSGFTYTGSSVPGSPTANETWRETTVGGAWVQDWEWTGSVWAALSLTNIPLDSFNGASPFNGVAVTTVRFANMPFRRALAVQIVSGTILTPTADASNRWDITVGFGSQQNSTFGTSAGSFSLTTTGTRIARSDALSGVSDGVNENCIYVVATRVGTPSNLTMGNAIAVRQVRV